MKKSILISIFLFSVFIFSSSVVFAAKKVNTCGDSQTTGYSCTADTSGKTCIDNKCLAEANNVKCCKYVASTKSIPNPLGTVTLEGLIARIINYALGLVGTISLLLFVYGGFIWMTSAGSSDKVKKGRDIIVWAVIGMAVVFMSYIAVKFVIQGLQGTL